MKYFILIIFILFLFKPMFAQDGIEKYIQFRKDNFQDYNFRSEKQLEKTVLYYTDTYGDEEYCYFYDSSNVHVGTYVSENGLTLDFLTEIIPDKLYYHYNLEVFFLVENKNNKPHRTLIVHQPTLPGNKRECIKKSFIDFGIDTAYVDIKQFLIRDRIGSTEMSMQMFSGKPVLEIIYYFDEYVTSEFTFKILKNETLTIRLSSGNRYKATALQDSYYGRAPSSDTSYAEHGYDSYIEYINAEQKFVITFNILLEVSKKCYKEYNNLKDKDYKLYDSKGKEIGRYFKGTNVK